MNFYLPNYIQNQAQQVSVDIADAWSMLTKMCIVKQFALDIAEAQVYYHVNTNQLSELEAIRKVYHDVKAS